MKFGITGVPGTGKSAVGKAFSKKNKYGLIALNDVVEKKGLYSGVDEFGTKIVRLKELERAVDDMLKKKGDVVVEGHHHCEMKLDLKKVVVLRTNPDVLRKRLRKFPKEKRSANVMSEMLDYCTILSEKNYKSVYEVDTSGKSVGESVGDVEKIVKGKEAKKFLPRIDWSKELFKETIKFREILGREA